MYPNYQVIKRLMTEQARLNNICQKLQKADVTVEGLGNIDLLDIVLDLIGFPKENRPVREIFSSGEEFDCVSRSKWKTAAFCSKKEEIDGYIEKLYAEYNELLAEQPELFRENGETAG